MIGLSEVFAGLVLGLQFPDEEAHSLARLQVNACIRRWRSGFGG
jgi:hypothetical protein